MIERIKWFVLLMIVLANPLYAAWPAVYSNVTNFHDVMNFTGINHNITFYGNKAGPVNYFYVTFSNTINVGASGWLFRGYNGSVFVGNVSGYLYSSGFLVSLKTQSGNKYGTLAMFWNQSINQGTASMADQNNNVSIDINAIKYPFLQYLVGLNQSFGPVVHPFKHNNVTFLGCSYISNQTCSWSFRPIQPYFFIEGKAYVHQNISVDYINKGGVQEGVITANSLNLSIIGKGLLGGGPLISKITTPLTILIAGNVTNPANAFAMGANQTFLASNGIGWNQNGTKYGLYNRSATASIGWLYTGTNNKATITIHTDNSSSVDTVFYLLPAYTTTFTNTTPFYNATPLNPVPAGCDAAPWFCFKFREQIKNITWSSNITSYAYDGHQNTKNVIKSNAGNTTFAIVNITHYAEMGNTCGQVYFRDYDNVTPFDHGAVNFSILSCTANSSTASFLIPNESTTGHVFNSLFMYWDSLKNQNGFDKPVVYNSWSLGNGAKYGYAYTTKPSVIRLNDVLTPNSIIRGQAHLTSDFRGWYYTANATRQFLEICSGAASCTLGNKVVDANTGDYSLNKVIWVVPHVYGCQSRLDMIMYGLSSDTTDGGFCNINVENRTAWDNNFGLGSVGSVNVSLTGGITAQSSKLFTTQFILNPKIDTNPLLSNKTLLPTTPIQLNVSANGTIIAPGNGLSNSSLWGNATYVLLKLGGNVTFYDLTIPVAVAFMLAIIEIILIGLMFTTENEWVVGFGLVAANFLGLTLFLGVKTIGVAFLLVSLIAAGYYVIKNAHKWWK
jgi:hypothetical protein